MKNIIKIAQFITCNYISVVALTDIRVHENSANEAGHHDTNNIDTGVDGRGPSKDSPSTELTPEEVAVIMRTRDERSSYMADGEQGEAIEMVGVMLVIAKQTCTGVIYVVMTNQKLW